VENLFHIHGSNDIIHSSSEIVDQLRSLSRANVLREPRCHKTEVQPGPQLLGGKGDTGPLPDPYHHHPLVVLRYDERPEASRLLFMVRSRQLLLQR
jgi:hypothetical protein